MGADERTFAALNTNLIVPYRNFESDISLLPRGGTGWKCSVDRHGAHRKLVAEPGNNFREDIFHKVGRLIRNDRRQLERTVNLPRHFHFEKIRQCLVDSIEIHLHDVLTLLPV